MELAFKNVYTVVEYCNTLQHTKFTATHCNTPNLLHELELTLENVYQLQNTATRCNTPNLPQHTATRQIFYMNWSVLSRRSTSCRTLQHTATHCCTLQYTAPHCTTLQYTATSCNTLHYPATHCNTLQHTAAHCNT